MAENNNKRLSRKELIRRNKRIAKKRQIKLYITVAVVTAFLVYVTGIYGASLAYLGDFLSSSMVYLKLGNGFPVAEQLSTYKQGKGMGSSLCILDAESFYFYSPTAKKIFTYYHSMQNPVLTTSNTRAVIYNLNETSLKIANANKILFSTEMENDIIHADISKNNTVTITTKSQSYNGEVAVFDYQMNKLLKWYSAKSFPINSFISQDGSSLAINTVLAQDGYLISDIYILDVAKGEEKYTIRRENQTVLAIEYLNNKQLMVLYDDYLEIFSLEDASTIAKYSYNGDNLLDYYIKNGQIYLALGGYTQGVNNKLAILSLTLEAVATIPIEQKIKDITVSNSRVYILGEKVISQYTLAGGHVNDIPAQPSDRALLDYNGSILVTQRSLDMLEKTQEE